MPYFDDSKGVIEMERASAYSAGSPECKNYMRRLDC